MPIARRFRLTTLALAATLGGPIPWAQVGVSSLAVVALFVAGCLYFRKVEDSFADII